MKNQPPKLLLRFFRWYCYPKLRDYIEGDLMEVYQKRLTKKGKRNADIQFTVDVVLLFRPGIIRPTERYQQLNNYGMLKNYFKIGIRNILKHKAFSFINIFGLAVAMSISMLLIMLLADQLSYDRHNTNGGRIYRINSIGVDEKGQMIETQQNGSSPMTIGPTLAENYTGLARVVRFRRGFGNSWLEFEDQSINIPLAGFFADEHALKMFQYELQYGDEDLALAEPYSVVLTRKAAYKLFKEENPVGQTIKVGDLGTYTVTGVLKETNLKSHIVFEGLASMSTVRSLETAGKLDKLSDNWADCWNTWTYVLTEPGKTASDLQKILDHISEKNIDLLTTPGVQRMKFSTQRLFDITPGDHKNNPIGPQMPWVFVYALGGLALVILLASCFNFTNLSIARSLTRAREIGVRKVTGAARWQIFSQFICESILISLFALVVAWLFVGVLKPLVLQLNFAYIFHWDFSSNLPVYLIFIAFAIMVGILAGFFPAVVLSGFQPVHVLKNLTSLKLFSRMTLRKALLVSQFTLSLFFILTVIILNNQLHLFTHQDHGFTMENNMVVKLNGTSAQNLKNELQKYSNITFVSAASHLPAAGTSNGTGFKRSLDAPEFISTAYFHVDEDYAANMGLRLLAGNFFKDESAANHQNSMVINEVALRVFQFATPQDAIGQLLVHQADSSEKVIIGVVSNYNHRTLTHKIEPLALLYHPDSFHLLQVGYQGPVEQARRAIETSWATINPGLKADYSEVKSEVNKFYDMLFGDLVSILGFISFFAILLSCLGLLGMATYAMESRMKEVCIRKVMGSSDRALMILLSKGFLSILGLATVIGIPLAYFFNNLWLEMIAYHTTIDLGTIGLSVVLLVIFGVLTVGSQTWRASKQNPSDTLRMD
jgi:putative ABC transport system permease protein